MGDFISVRQLESNQTQVDLILKPMLIPLHVTLGVCSVYLEVPVKVDMPVMTHAKDY